jgi:serine/threonine-protein kinase
MTEQDTGEFIRIQTALAGRYSLERELGRGGMGIVYLARDVALDRLVALKLLPPKLASEPSLRQRFLNEARTAAKLSHPNIIPIFAVEEVGDLVFFVMAFVDGETLGQRIRARGPLPASELGRILREVAWGLAYAHGQGVVHRDVKADNILLEAGSGRALVADFGIAHVAANAGVTGVGEILGTAEYMSPEQASGEAVDHRSDIYSLGVVAFYALSGRLPFEGPTVASVLAKQITQPAPLVAEAVEGVPSKLGHAVDRCLAKDPAQRFPKAEDLADAVAVMLEARRELPPPMRVFIRRSREVSQLVGGVVFLELLFSVEGLVFSVIEQARAADIFMVLGVVGALVALVPVWPVIAQARALLKAGYGRGELIVAWKAEIERQREERAFEFGRTAPWGERITRWIASIGLLSGAAGLWGADSWRHTSMTAILAVGVGFTAAVFSFLRYERRTDLGGRLMAKFWNSRLGRWAFKLAGLKLSPSAIAAPATHRPTELALGMAVDALFEALPKPARQQLQDLPAVVRGLETDAMKMRQRVNELNDAVAKIEAGNRAGPTPDGLSSRREAIDKDIRAARDVAKRRLADAVTALEGIRLNLLRLTAGAGSVDSLTADLAAAKEVSEGVGRLLEGHREIERDLRGVISPVPGH